jgi:hypothetical protein
MKFAAKTEKEIQSQNVWPKGEYAFEILESEETKDKNQNDMLKLKVKIFKDSGQSQNVFDYVSGTWMEFKLRHLAEASGLLPQYEQGEIEAYNFVGKTGMAKVGIAVDKNGEYPDKNSIVDYLVDRVDTPKKQEIVDDSIPF